MSLLHDSGKQLQCTNTEVKNVGYSFISIFYETGGPMPLRDIFIESSKK